MVIESVNPRLEQNQIAKELGYSSSTSKRYRNNKSMLSSYRISPKSRKRRQKTSNEDLNTPKMTSDDLKNLNWIQKNP